MSHRVTTDTEIKDKTLAIQACKTAGISYVEQGNDSLRFTSGKLNNATLDLRSGRITGDSDYGHTSEALGVLKQAYGESKYRQECMKQGISIESRVVDQQGNIVLMCAMG
jgi:hypothetical protein